MFLEIALLHSFLWLSSIPSSIHTYTYMGFPGGWEGKVSACNVETWVHFLDPQFEKIPWRRKWQSTLVLLPGKFHGQRSLVGYSIYMCMQHIFFIHSFFDGNLGYFQVLTTVNSAAMNFGAYVSCWIRVYSGYILRNGATRYPDKSISLEKVKLALYTKDRN